MSYIYTHTYCCSTFPGCLCSCVRGAFLTCRGGGSERLLSINILIGILPGHHSKDVFFVVGIINVSCEMFGSATHGRSSAAVYAVDTCLGFFHCYYHISSSISSFKGIKKKCVVCMYAMLCFSQTAVVVVVVQYDSRLIG